MFQKYEINFDFKGQNVRQKSIEGTGQELLEGIQLFLQKEGKSNQEYSVQIFPIVDVPKGTDGRYVGRPSYFTVFCSGETNTDYSEDLQPIAEYMGVSI